MLSVVLSLILLPAHPSQDSLPRFALPRTARLLFVRTFIDLGPIPRFRLKRLGCGMRCRWQRKRMRINAETRDESCDPFVG